MKKLLMLILVGCLVTPTVFAGENIQLAAAVGSGPSPQLNDDNDNRGGLIYRGEAGSGASKALDTTAAIVATGAFVAGVVMALAKTKSTSSH